MSDSRMPGAGDRDPHHDHAHSHAAHDHDDHDDHDHGDHDHGDHDHGHDHRHGHHHHHHHHHHAARPDDPRFAIGVALNLAIVLAETGAGVFGHSTALLADAGHNLSDVLGLALAGVAAWLAGRPARGRRTYGYGKATVLAALANGVALVFVSGAIAVEALRRLAAPERVHAPVVMIAAAIGVAINTATALMFMRDREHDLNARGAFLHMAGDALISVGVIAAGGAVMLTGWQWIDPLVSLVIVAIILVGAWSVLVEALDLAMDAAPSDADLPGIEALIRGSAGVTDVHDLHVWALSTTEVALTAHIVRPERGDEDGFRDGLTEALQRRFGVRHATLQIEAVRNAHCPVC